VTARGLGAAFLVLLLAGSRPARAYHDPTSQRIVTNTAHTLQKNEFRLGIFRFDYGVVDWFTVGTYTLPWFVLAPNIQLKFRVRLGQRWAIGWRPSFLFLDLGLFLSEGTTAKLFFVPLELFVTVDVARPVGITVSGSLNNVFGDGNYNRDELKGAAAIANVQAAANVEWRITRSWALVLEGRYLAYQANQTVGASNIQVNDFTTLEVHGDISLNTVDLQHAFSASLAAVLSLKTFNLRFGAGYGNFNIPGLNIVWPDRYPFPELDIFWRW
jgi:hypothetical protein